MAEMRAHRREQDVGFASDQQLHEREACWVCMSGGSLARLCECPRVAHPLCSARWQLHRAGSDEEVACRFCKQTLPDWRPVLASAAATGSGWAPGDDELVPRDQLQEEPAAEAFMRISYNGKSHKVRMSGEHAICKSTPPLDHACACAQASIVPSCPGQGDARRRGEQALCPGLPRGEDRSLRRSF